MNCRYAAGAGMPFMLAARRAVPFLYFYSGMHADYHGPGDSPDKIDVEKLARISRLMFYVGVAVANADRRPQWDPARFARLVPRR